MDTIRSVYKSFNENITHKMSIFDPRSPKYNELERIEEMCESFGITLDEIKVHAAQIVLEPL